MWQFGRLSMDRSGHWGGESWCASRTDAKWQSSYLIIHLHILSYSFQILSYLIIWVSFPRTGKMSVLREFFFKSRRLVWLNQTILTTSVDLWWLIMTFSFWKSWIWLLLSKKNTFYCTLNLTQFSNFTVTLTLSCYQTWWDGLDLTCPSFRGLNFDDFPFFCFHNRTSRSRVSLIQRFRGNCGHLRNLLCGAVQPAAGADDDYHDL